MQANPPPRATAFGHFKPFFFVGHVWLPQFLLPPSELLQGLNAMQGDAGQGCAAIPGTLAGGENSQTLPYLLGANFWVKVFLWCLQRRRNVALRGAVVGGTDPSEGVQVIPQPCWLVHPRSGLQGRCGLCRRTSAWGRSRGRWWRSTAT